MDTPDPNAEPPRYTNQDWDWPWWAKPAFSMAGVILPLICLAISYPGKPTWQSDNADAYAALLLAHKSSAPLYPFFLYNMICMGLLIRKPIRYARIFLVRLGVYSGVVLALQCWLLFGIASMEGQFGPVAFLVFGVYSVLFAVAPLLVGWFIAFLGGKTWSETFAAALIAIFLAAATLCLPVLIPFCLFCSTPWAVVAYTAMAIFVFRNSGVGGLRFTLARLFGVTTWAGAFFGAWRTAYLVMLQEYAKLPTTPPSGSCYLCTAAARGHRRLVGAEEQLLPDGTVRRVNDQTRYFKAAELLLMTVSPGGHRRCRRIYDCLGPRLAAMLIHPVAADAAYLSLKPLEWAVRAGLALVSPECRQLIQKLYRG